MTNSRNNDKPYDLEERTAKFAEDIIEFAKLIPANDITRPTITQLVKAGTSTGANYCEADCAESKKDFEHKLGICNKEAKETKYWIRITVKAMPDLREQAKPLWKEANELNLIFSAIIKKSKGKNIGH